MENSDGSISHSSVLKQVKRYQTLLSGNIIRRRRSAAVSVFDWPAIGSSIDRNAQGQWKKKILLINGKDHILAFESLQRNGVTEETHLSYLLRLEGCDVLSELKYFSRRSVAPNTLFYCYNPPITSIHMHHIYSPT